MGVDYAFSRIFFSFVPAKCRNKSEKNPAKRGRAVGVHRCAAFDFSSFLFRQGAGKNEEKSKAARPPTLRVGGMAFPDFWGYFSGKVPEK